MTSFNKLSGPLFLLAGTIVIATCPGCQNRQDLEQSQNKSPPKTSTDTQDSPWTLLFRKPRLEQWNAIDFGGREDAFEIEDGRIAVEMGYPMAGFVYTGDDFPTQNYRLELAAQKIEGTDFFCCLSFPVNDQFCSLVLGGWGGTVTGISCIDKNDASDNETKTIRKYHTGQWYQVRIDVTDDRLECWIDNEQIVDLELAGIELSLRTEVESCKPLGLCSFSTSAAWKNLRYKRLK